MSDYNIDDAFQLHINDDRLKWKDHLILHKESKQNKTLLVRGIFFIIVGFLLNSGLSIYALFFK